MLGLFACFFLTAFSTSTVDYPHHGWSSKKKWKTKEKKKNQRKRKDER